jgi:putative transposase
VCKALDVSERRACRTLGQSRSTQRHRPIKLEDEDALTHSIILLASRFGRYGYRRITALLQHAGWRVNHKRVERIWREHGLKVPKKQTKRGRLWLNDGSCVRLKPCWPNHVWSYDFVTDRTIEGRSLKIFTVLDEYSRECLAIEVERSLQSIDVLERLADLFIKHGLPDYIRSDNGPEFTAKQLRAWLGRLGVSTLFIEPGSPWENGYVESFNGKLRDECLNRELFTTLVEAKVLIEQWRNEYNQIRPHSSCGYRPPAPEAILPLNLGSATLHPNPMALTQELVQ